MLSADVAVNATVPVEFCQSFGDLTEDLDDVINEGVISVYCSGDVFTEVQRVWTAPFGRLEKKKPSE